MSDQAFQISAVAAMWMALSLIVLALCFDRVVQLFKPRRRCPKCWYDMSHSPSMTCSECGFTAKRERKLFKGRRRWKLVWLALLLMIAGHGMRVAPAVRQRGWVAAVPTTVLILSVPMVRPDLNVVQREVFPRLVRALVRSASSTVQPSAADWQSELILELESERLNERSLQGWQKALFESLCGQSSEELPNVTYVWNSLSDRLLGTTTWSDGTKLNWDHLPPPAKCEFNIRSRPVWPIGAPMYCDFELSGSGGCNIQATAEPCMAGLQKLERSVGPFQGFRCGGTQFSFPWSDGLESIGRRFTVGSLSYVVTILQGDQAPAMKYLFIHPMRWLQLSRTKIDIATVSGTVNDLLTPVENQPLCAAMPGIMKPFFGPDLPGSSGVILSLGLDPAGYERLITLLDDATLAVTADVHRNQRSVATAEFWYSRRFNVDYLPGIASVSIPLTSVDKAALQDASPADTWSLVLRGDPIVALRDFQATKYWRGEVEIPLRMTFRKNAAGS